MDGQLVKGEFLRFKAHSGSFRLKGVGSLKSF